MAAARRRRPAHGSGSQRLYSFRDILVLKVVKRLLDAGISLQQIRAAVQHLRDHGSDDLAKVTLISDGVSVYECTSADEVVDLLQGGQGVFGIALGRVWREVEGDLAVLPAVRAEDRAVDLRNPISAAQDDLAKRSAAPHQLNSRTPSARRRHRSPGDNGERVCSNAPIMIRAPSEASGPSAGT